MIPGIKFDKIKSIAILEIISGMILLIWEIHDFIKLPTTFEADEMYGGLVDFIKYKENTYCLLYLWTILLFTGISFFINKKLHWVFTQISLIVVFLIWEVIFISLTCYYGNIYALTLSIIALFLFLWLQRRIYKSYNFTIKTGVNNKTKYISVILGTVSYVIYFILERHLS